MMTFVLTPDSSPFIRQTGREIPFGDLPTTRRAIPKQNASLPASGEILPPKSEYELALSHQRLVDLGHIRNDSPELQAWRKLVLSNADPAQ